MIVTYEVSPEKLAGLMDGHIEEILQKEIAHLMKERMAEIVEEASKTIARNLRSTVVGFREMRNQEVIFIVKIDGVEKDIGRKA